MIETVAAVRVLRPYVVEVTFDAGVQREVDMEPLLSGEDFHPLRDPNFFAKVAENRNGGTIAWPNGADLAPEFLSYGEAGPPPGYRAGEAGAAPEEEDVPVLSQPR